MNSSMELWRLLEKLSVTVHYQVRESFHMIKNLVSVSHQTFFCLRRGVLKTKTSKTLPNDPEHQWLGLKN